MEGNGMGGGMIPGMGGGMLGLDMSLHQTQHHPHQPQMIPFAASASEHNSQQPQKQQQGYGYTAKGKSAPVAANLSDEEEQGFGDEAVAGDGSGKRVSPWQRMKWTDSMVRLLIMVVYYVGGDDGGGGGDGGQEKKKGGGGGGGLLQKKGKWKSVSRAMMEKGFYVSPQQCEDKFNDLNKRYKRVNDILGKGTACRVVENQSLLDTLDHINPKTKEEVRKLLNSKHLFFREMCAYHSSCAHNGAHAHAESSGGGAAATALDSSNSQHQHQPQQRCSHEAARGDNKDIVKATGGVHHHHHYVDEDEVDDVAAAEGDDDEEDEEEEEEDDDEDEEYDIAEDETEGGGGVNHHGDEKDGRKRGLAKRRRSPLERSSSSSCPVQQLRNELMRVAEEGNKSPWEQKDWIRRRAVELEEQRAGYLTEALELEKQRFKWLKFSGKKERELEKLKLDNERRRLENDRMVLLLRHKDLELDLHSKTQPEPSSLTGGG